MTEQKEAKEKKRMRKVISSFVVISRKNLVVFGLLILAGLVCLGQVSACPANPEPFILNQPDGTSFQARQVGDEWCHGIETLDGYTIVKDSNEWWTYAEKDLEGLLVPSNNIVGKSNPTDLGLKRHLVPKPLLQPVKQPTVSALAPTPQGVPSTGTVNVIAIRVNFSDVGINTATHDQAYFDNLLNGATGSLHDYYDEASDGQLNVVGTVAGNIYTLPNTMASYSNPETWTIIRDAINLADPDINFANYDAVMIYHAGAGEETSSIANDYWSMRWYNLNIPTNDGVTFTSGTVVPEYEIAPNSALGVTCHEFGHEIGLPDLYDTDRGIDYGAVVGGWGLMDGGTWNNHGNTPTYPTAWCRANLGWTIPQVVTVKSTISVHQVETIQTANPEVYRVNINANEHFLIENRQAVVGSYDQYIPESGILIYHIDTSMPDNIGNTNPPVRDNDGPPDNSYYKVQLEQPGGAGNDAYGNPFGGPNYRGAIPTAAYSLDDCHFVFNPIIAPNSSSNNGTKTNISIITMSREGSVMNVTINPNTAESEAAIQAGLAWLHWNQNPDGSWGGNVGYTSLAALAFLNYGIDESDPTVSKAMNYILSKKHADGSIYVSYSNYETSLAILPLVATHNSSYDDEIAAARNFLVGIQNDEDEGLTNSDWTYGGWGYAGNSPSWSDLSNTQWSLMGLDAANLSKTSDTWSKGEIYVTRCQNLQATNPYAVTNDGGFTYQPPNISCCWGCGGDPSQSYGSITAAGVWSLRLCDVNTADQKVQAGLNWLRNNYAPIDTVGNPCHGNTYLYYYLLSFAKALIMTDIPAGSWQETASQDITNYIVNQQYDDGHWSSNEGDLFATEQAILALQTRTIPTDIQRLSYLTFILHSNADLHVYDPLGRHVGMNYDTGEIEIQIPNATYSVDPQNITIPELIPGNYRIVLVGTGTGEYTLDVTGGVGDEIVSDDSFTSTISEGEVHDANVNVAMITWLTIHVDEPEPTDAMVQSATGTGNVSFVADSGTIEDLTALNESDLPEENTAIDFPHGLFSFNITGLSDGETVNVTINFPQDIPTTAEYWKYHTPEGWYQIPMGSNDGDNIITIQLTDGGIGDDDGIANGVIVDQGGPGVSAMILATVDFDPDTLNKKSKGKWVTVYTELPAGCNVTDINVSTMMLNETVPAELQPTEVGDYDSDGIPDLMVKFDRQAVIDIFPIGDAVSITVTGNLYDGTPFEGSDTVRVIDKGKGK